MVIWSSLKSVVTKYGAVASLTSRRCMSEHRTMVITPSRWQWDKLKDYAHLYVCVAAIPIGIIIFYANVFVGPATLSEIPEGYVPKHWEYYRHPITRFIARYILNPPQQEYEKMLHYLFEEDEKRSLRKIESAIKEKLEERADYQAYYYRPILGKYHRVTKEAAEYTAKISGD